MLKVECSTLRGRDTVATIKVVILDWAGTTVDHGSFAPVAAFMAAFAHHGVEVTAAEARGPMGLHKKDHIRAMLQMPSVAQRWGKVHGRSAGAQDVESLYQRFMPHQLEVIASHCRLVAGLLPCVAELRRHGIQIGATTGYFKEAAESVYREARRQGFYPDHTICAEEVPAGRPAPWMIFRTMEALGVYPPDLVVKVGDTVPDIDEGRNAGVWSIGVTRTGSEIGCHEEELAALPETQRSAKLAAARQQLLHAGAHEVLESVADLPVLIENINARLQRGDRP